MRLCKSISLQYFKRLQETLLVGPVSVEGAHILASGGSLASFVRGNVYALALVHYYPFMPMFDIERQHEQVVDALVYSPEKTLLDVELVRLFMDMRSPARSKYCACCLFAIFITCTFYS